MIIGHYQQKYSFIDNIIIKFIHLSFNFNSLKLAQRSVKLDWKYTNFVSHPDIINSVLQINYALFTI